MRLGRTVLGRRARRSALATSPKPRGAQLGETVVAWRVRSSYQALRRPVARRAGAGSSTAAWGVVVRLGPRRPTRGARSGRRRGAVRPRSHGHAPQRPVIRALFPPTVRGSLFRPCRSSSCCTSMPRLLARSLAARRVVPVVVEPIVCDRDGEHAPRPARRVRKPSEVPRREGRPSGNGHCRGLCNPGADRTLYVDAARRGCAGAL